MTLRQQIQELPRLTRPNLIARLYMLFVAEGTVEIAWMIPSSATTRILESGGMLATAVLWVMTAATILGLVDVLFNDVARICEHPRGVVGRVANWLHSHRIGVCYVIGGCYLVQAYAGLGAEIEGTGWLLLYYLKLAILASMLAWSLLFLAVAEGNRAGHS